MLIRYAKPDYANRLTDLIKQVEESNFMLFEPGERKTSPEQLRKRIESMEEDETSEMLIAEENDSLIGYLFVIGGNPNRSKHSVYIVIGVSEEYRGKGVGTMLFQELDKWAIQKTSID